MFTPALRRVALAVGSLALVAGSLAGGGVASAQPPTDDNPAGNVSGVVPVHGFAGKPSVSGGNLVNHGGPVLNGNTVHTLFWGAAAQDPTYKSLINQYFTDVAGGSARSVYDANSQYGAPGATTFAGTVDDLSQPPNTCTDTTTASDSCVSDESIQAEIRTVAATWQLTSKDIVFVFTGPRVGSCYSSSSCAFSNYCAYHSHTVVGATTIEYANQPWTESAPNGCGTGESPNNYQAADSTLNVVSHEHNEAITDPLGNAWYDRRGYENGDKCAWNFGVALGQAGKRYNQTIGGHPYYLQQEWSNKSSGCVLTGL